MNFNDYVRLALDSSNAFSFPYHIGLNESTPLFIDNQDSMRKAALRAIIEAVRDSEMALEIGAELAAYACDGVKFYIERGMPRYFDDRESIADWMHRIDSVLDRSLSIYDVSNSAPDDMNMGNVDMRRVYLSSIVDAYAHDLNQFFKRNELAYRSQSFKMYSVRNSCVFEASVINSTNVSKR